jgi:hypothetical protein
MSLGNTKEFEAVQMREGPTYLHDCPKCGTAITSPRQYGAQYCTNTACGHVFFTFHAVPETEEGKPSTAP